MLLQISFSISANLCDRNSISLLIFWLVIFAYICVAFILVCPNRRLTVSIGTPLDSSTVVAFVCLQLYLTAFWIRTDCRFLWVSCCRWYCSGWGNFVIPRQAPVFLYYLSGNIQQTDIGFRVSLLSSGDNPYCSIPFWRAGQNSSLINREDTLWSSFICFLVKSHSIPNRERSTAKSISSEKRSIWCQTLLNDVPPLKMSLSEKDLWR